MSAAGYLLNKRDTYKPSIDAPTLEILNDFKDSIAFHRTLNEYEPTPVENLPVLSKQLGLGNIYIKNEGLRFGTSALKVLGASYAIKKTLLQKEHVLGICTATDGNHGRAVAWVARKKDIKAVIFVPNHTSASRINYIENEGAQVRISDGDYDQSVKEAKTFSKENDYLLIQDTAWKNYTKIPALITAGYYTQMHEIYAELLSSTGLKVDVIFIQAGVGSWPSAIVHFLREFKQNHTIKIVCVEPYESDAIYESIRQSGLASTSKSQETIMAGLNCGTPSTLAYEILKNGADAFAIISDKFALDAIKYLNAPLPGDPYIPSGESGSAGLGGLLATMNMHTMSALRKFLNLNKSSNVLLFNTETVTDPASLEEILAVNHEPLLKPKI